MSETWFGAHTPRCLPDDLKYDRDVSPHISLQPGGFLRLKGHPYEYQSGMFSGRTSRSNHD